MKLITPVSEGTQEEILRVFALSVKTTPSSKLFSDLSPSVGSSARGAPAHVDPVTPFARPSRCAPPRGHGCGGRGGARETPGRGIGRGSAFPRARSDAGGRLASRRLRGTAAGRGRLAARSDAGPGSGSSSWSGREAPPAVPGFDGSDCGRRGAYGRGVAAVRATPRNARRSAKSSRSRNLRAAGDNVAPRPSW